MHDSAPAPDAPEPEIELRQVTLADVAARAATIAECEATLSDHDLSLGAERGVAGVEQRFALACERLGLDELERAILAAVALREVSPELGAALGRLAPPAPGGAATPRAAARLLAGDGVSVADVLVALGPHDRLRGLGAVRSAPPPDGIALADRPIVLADRLAGVLLGAVIDDPARGGRLRRVAPTPLPFGRERALERIAGLLGPAPAARPPLAVHGPDAALAIACATGRGLVCVACADLADAELAQDAVLAAALEDRVLVVDRLGVLQAAERAMLPDRLARVPGAVLCLEGADELPALEHVPVVAVAVGMPTRSERAAIWSAALGGLEVDPQISAAHRLGLERIADGAWLAGAEASAAGRPQVSRADVEQGARAASISSLGDLALAMAPDIGWEDLVLPERPLALLRSLTAFLRHRDLVLDEWGFGRRSGRAQGLVAMFAGDSGTGKTLAARVLAAELGLELFRIDLATVVSKWLGETEKNLDRVFAAAQGANAVLFFDEADAVFGRRSDVQDSHDRYANLQTAYLLQRMERHDGPVLLATNMRGNVDDAFLRRMDAVVEFPFPTAEFRLRLWELLLPPEAPRGDDVDLSFLAERFELSGGGIRNAAIAAAVLAASDGVSIGMEQLVRGVAMEYAKHGRLTLAADFERFHDLVRSGGTP
ncbi:MAG: ATP-binding protein [Solirubrobacteraceae bacterium]|nr:ATP-binding protein [Solirubrobacteraceae bacterium]